MTSFGLTVLAVVTAYLLGSIPFAFVLVWWLKGIDIRTVGSGNVGATNAARVLGFAFFWVIFVLDVAKGLLPTLLFPRLVATGSGAIVPGLPVGVGVAAILGHNFPLYLRFRGGKGVATSFGVLLALDPVACVGAFFAFVVVLAVTRFVSVSSVAGGFGFASVHFARVDQPWGRERFVMSVATLFLLVLIVVRHRRNFLRIAAGTEPKVPLTRRKPSGPRPQGPEGPR